MRHENIATPVVPATKEEWARLGWPCYTVEQKMGEMLVIWPGAYHSGINTGYNIAEALNFCTRNWLNEGARYELCTCEEAVTEPVILDINEHTEAANCTK